MELETDELKYIEKIWLDNAFDGFPRDIGFPNRVYVKNKESYLKEIWAHVTIDHCYNSLYPDLLIDNNFANKLFIDFDDRYEIIKNKEGDIVKYFFSESSLKKSFLEMRRCVKKLDKDYDCLPRVNFTAGRGFGLYIDFPRIILTDYQYSAREFVRNLTKRMKTIDFNIVGDMRRLYRLPYTLHPKTRCLCIPIDPSWSLKKIMKESKECTFSYEHERKMCENVSNELLEFDSYEDNTMNVTIDTSDEIQKGIMKIKLKSKYEGQVRTILERASKVTDGRHRIMHFLLIPRLIYMKKDDEEIIETCKMFIENSDKDFDEYEKYVILSIKRNRDGKDRKKGDPWRPWSFKVFRERNTDIKGVI